MIKVKKIKPVFTQILVSARKYEHDVKEHGVVTITAGTLMEYQQVIAVGSTVRTVKEGDLIKVNPKRYAVRKHDDNSVRNDLNLNPIVGFNFPIVHINDVPNGGSDLMLLDEQDVEYIVEDFEEVEDEEPNKSTLIIPNKEIIV